MPVGPEMLHKVPGDADVAGPQTSGHPLNSEADDKLLERGKKPYHRCTHFPDHP